MFEDPQGRSFGDGPEWNLGTVFDLSGTRKGAPPRTGSDQIKQKAPWGVGIWTLQGAFEFVFVLVIL